MIHAWSLEAQWIGQSQTYKSSHRHFGDSLQWTACTQGQPIAGLSHRDQTISEGEEFLELYDSVPGSVTYPESGRHLLCYQCELATVSCSPTQVLLLLA